jgi:hypothetical protein
MPASLRLHLYITYEPNVDLHEITFGITVAWLLVFAVSKAWETTAAPEAAMPALTLSCHGFSGGTSSNELLPQRKELENECYERCQTLLRKKIKGIKKVEMNLLPLIIVYATLHKYTYENTLCSSATCDIWSYTQTSFMSPPWDDTCASITWF